MCGSLPLGPAHSAIIYVWQSPIGSCTLSYNYIVMLMLKLTHLLLHNLLVDL